MSERNGTTGVRGGETVDSSAHFDFVALVRDQAKSRGMEPEALLWAAAKSMFDKAAAGDAAAAKLIFDRCCGIQGGRGVSVAIDNRSVSLGPPAPATQDIGSYIANMNKVAAQIGVLVHADGTDQDELEDLLS